MAKSENWNWKDKSRQEWSHSAGPPDSPEDYFALGVGCLMRIAASLETLVYRSDPRTIENADKIKAQAKKRKARWSIFEPYCVAVHDAETKAIDRLFAGQKRRTEIKQAVERLYFRGLPRRPYDILGGSVPIDPVVCEQWRVESVAYWDGITELPLQIAGQGTKKQARYVEWLSSLNGEHAKIQSPSS